MSTSAAKFYKILRYLDWSGHIELGDNDLLWLAGQLELALKGNRHICGSCGLTNAIIIRTRLGPLCEDCIEEASDQVDEVRDELES